jgi:hypothetical protein
MEGPATARLRGNYEQSGNGRGRCRFGREEVVESKFLQRCLGEFLRSSNRTVSIVSAAAAEGLPHGIDTSRMPRNYRVRRAEVVASPRVSPSGATREEMSVTQASAWPRNRRSMVASSPTIATSPIEVVSPGSRSLWKSGEISASKSMRFVCHRRVDLVDPAEANGDPG